MLAPQVDATKGWARPHTNTPPVAIRLALEILDKIEKQYSIDRAREYVVGQSMGGEGVWAALSIAPQTIRGGDCTMRLRRCLHDSARRESSGVDISRRGRSCGAGNACANMGSGITQSWRHAEVHGVSQHWPQCLGCSVQRAGAGGVVVLAPIRRDSLAAKNPNGTRTHRLRNNRRHHWKMKRGRPRIFRLTAMRTRTAGWCASHSNILGR